MILIVSLVAAVLVVGGLWLARRMIGAEPGRHEGTDDDFDWRERPIYARGPDKLDRLISTYALPVQALADLLATDRLIAHADAVLGAR